MPPVSSRTTMMSTPFKSSALIGEACSTAGCGTIGRRLANSPSDLRSCSRPCSGRTGASGADHFGPPTAPSSIASARCASASVAGRQRLAGRIDRGAAEQRRLEFKGMSGAGGDRAQGPHRLSRDFAADAVAGKNRDQCFHCDAGIARDAS